jgi:hypothetical protein
METLTLERVYLPDRTLGSIYRGSELICKTLELRWNDNKKSSSCIPEGTYKVIQQPPKPDRPYPYFRLPVVTGRSGILIHRGTKPDHSLGCILVASRFTKTETAYPELQESGVKLQWMIENLPDEFLLEIKKK